jgi:hypothetical protein
MAEFYLLERRDILTRRSSYIKFPTGLLGVNITSLNLHSPGFAQAQNVEKKKAEPRTPHFLGLNQDYCSLLLVG